MLVATLKVYVRRKRQLIVQIEHSAMAHSGFKPDIQDISLFLKGSAAARAHGPFRQQLMRVTLKPEVYTVFRDKGYELFNRLWRYIRLAATCAVKHRYRHAPGTLPRNAPVRSS
jgi:hypothetical protein